MSAVENGHEPVDVFCDDCRAWHPHESGADGRLRQLEPCTSPLLESMGRHAGIVLAIALDAGDMELVEDACSVLDVNDRREA